MIAVFSLLALFVPNEGAPSSELPELTLVPSPTRLAPAAQENYPGFSYTFVEANYLWTDVDAVDDSLDGWETRVSVEIFFNLFLQGSYSQIAGDADLDQTRLGLGFHLPVGGRIDAFGILSYAHEELDGSGFDESEDGVVGEVGGRFWLLDRLELNGEVIWADIEESDAGLGVGARFYVIPALSLGASMSVIDEDESFALGARFQF